MPTLFDFVTFFTYGPGPTVGCFVLSRTSQIKHPEHMNGKPPCNCKESKEVTCWKPKGPSNQKYHLWILQTNHINATYVDELLCWYRFLLLQKSMGKANKNLPTQKSIYSDGTLLGQRNQLVHLCFSDGDEQHLDRIPRKKSFGCCCHKFFFGSWG